MHAFLHDLCGKPLMQSPKGMAFLLAGPSTTGWAVLEALNEPSCSYSRLSTAEYDVRAFFTKAPNLLPRQ